MRRLFTQVRLDLKIQAPPWLISEQRPAAIWKNVAETSGTLRTWARTETGVFMVPTSHMPYQQTHFGAQGTLLLGEELAKAYWQQQRRTARP